MKKGQDISINELKSPLDYKMLNDALNSILGELWKRFDLSDKYGIHIFTSTETVSAGQNKDVIFDREFAQEPQIFVCNCNGAAVKATICMGETDMKKKAKISFVSSSASGNINIMVIGKVLL